MAQSINSSEGRPSDLESLKPTMSEPKELKSVPRCSTKPVGSKSRFQCSFRPDTKTVYDAVLGLSDGLTVPFALTAGLASVGSTRIVILGGLAELIAGAISMGLGGFVGSKSESEAYETSVRQCEHLIAQRPSEARNIVEEHFVHFCLREEEVSQLADRLCGSPATLSEFLLAHHFEVSKPDASRPYVSALTLGLSYFLGGFVALIPYLCVRKNEVYKGLWISIGLMTFIMFAFGYVKTAVVRGWSGRENVWAGLKGAVQMLIIGALAVGAAVGLVRAVESGHTF